MIKFGTNRIVIIGKRWVYKLPIFSRGFRANKCEYENYLNNAGVIATTYKKWYGLKQERLFNITVYRYRAKLEDILPEHFNLYYKHIFHNRLQVGKSFDGKWKIFDAEDVKYYEDIDSGSCR